MYKNQAQMTNSDLKVKRVPGVCVIKCAIKVSSNDLYQYFRVKQGTRDQMGNALLYIIKIKSLLIHLEFNIGFTNIYSAKR